jgi:zinc transport system substrate-binding protein
MRIVVMSRGLVLLLSAALAVPLTGCAGEAADGRPTVVASFYPLAFLVSRIAGDSVRVASLTSPGVEPHDLELSVRQVAEVSGADLVVYERRLQPAVDQAVDQNARDHSLDVATVVHLTDDNPHFWLDPVRFREAAVAVERRLATVAPTHATAYAANLGRLEDELTTLDHDYATGLADCARTLVVTSHDAFGYLARYGLRFAPIAGLAPDAEPSPAHLGRLRRLIRTAGITTVFGETLASRKLADTLAHDLGLRTAVLDPVEGVREGTDDDYLSLMRANLANLQRANGCAA